MKQSRIIGTALIVANGVLIVLCAIFYLGKDRKEPEFTFQTVETVYKEEKEVEELLVGVTAWDKEDGDLSSRIVIEKISENREDSTAVVFYAVSDKAGNVARASRVFEAVFADQDEESVANRFLDAGIEAELKEGNVVSSPVKPSPGIIPIPTGRPTETPVPVESTMPTGGPTQTPVAEPERESESEDSREPENMPGAMPGPETEPEAVPDQETGNTASAQAPILSLRESEVEVKVGQGPAWVDLIETLSDDKDGYETLFRNLNVSRYDRNKPGTYQVSVSTQDTDGNQSEAVPLTIIVK